MSFEAIIFDLDQTLIDTSKIEQWRNEKNWEKCKIYFHFTALLPHVKEVLQKIRFSTKLAVVTNSSIHYAKPLLEYHQISYDELIAFNPNGRNKPYPDQLLACAEKLNVSPDNCLYVGDMPFDIVAAKTAGMTSVGIVRDWGDMVKLIPYLPDLIISQFNELLEFIKYRQDPNYESAIQILKRQIEQAYRQNNFELFYQLLKKGCRMGDGYSLYHLARLIFQNSLPVEGEKNHLYYFNEAAKRMVPQAIYMQAYFLEQTDQIETANHLYRTAAYLGNPSAQIKYAQNKMKVSSSSLTVKIANKMLKNSLDKGNQKAEPLLTKTKGIIDFEEKLKKHLKYEKSKDIYYLQHYYTTEGEQDEFSKKILLLKDEDVEAITYFFEKLNPLLIDDLVFVYVPSSSKDRIITGVRKLAMSLACFNGIDGTDCLVRTVTKEKSSKGGERSVDIHLKTMETRDRDLISGKHIFLMDDVTTSGSSLLASEQLLLKAGALHVTKLALGRTK